MRMFPDVFFFYKKKRCIFLYIYKRSNVSLLQIDAYLYTWKISTMLVRLFNLTYCYINAKMVCKKVLQIFYIYFTMYIIRRKLYMLFYDEIWDAPYIVTYNKRLCKYISYRDIRISQRKSYVIISIFLLCWSISSVISFLWPPARLSLAKTRILAVTPHHRIVIIAALRHVLPKHIEQLRVGILKYRYDIEINHTYQSIECARLFFTKIRNRGTYHQVCNLQITAISLFFLHSDDSYDKIISPLGKFCIYM